MHEEAATRPPEGAEGGVNSRHTMCNDKRGTKSRRSSEASPSVRPGISYSVEDCRGRWSYMVNEGSPHIKRGYRLGLSFTQCLRSMFQLHNETVNVWSHLFGAILFVWLVFYVRDSPAFERPRAIVQSVVESIPFQANFNSSIFEEEFCGPDDGLVGDFHSNASNFTAGNFSNLNDAAANRNRTQTCKLRNEQMAFSSARRHFAAAKNILQVPRMMPLVQSGDIPSLR